MAINWGSATTGAMSGAAMGTAIGGPGWGTAIGAVGGGLLGMFGGSEGQTQQVNPYADRYWNLLQGNLGNFQKQQAAAEQKQTGYLSASQRGYADLRNFQPTAQYDPQAALRAFNAQQPYMQRQAMQGFSPFGDAQGTAADRAKRTAQSIAAQYGGQGALQSGAAQKAIAEGAGRAAGDVNLQLDQMFMGRLQGLEQGARAQIEQGYATQLQNQQLRDQLRFQGLGAYAGGMQSIGGQYGQRALGYGQLVGQTQSSMGQVASPEFTYQAPQNQMLDALQYGTGLALQAKSAGMLQGPVPGTDTQTQVDQNAYQSIFGQGSPTPIVNQPQLRGPYAGNEIDYQNQFGLMTLPGMNPLNFNSLQRGRAASPQFTLPSFGG